MFFVSFVILLIWCAPSNCSHGYDFDVKGNSLYGYFISIFIGTPAQNINMLIDTGSSNLAVSVAPQVQGSNYFMYNKSRTFQNLNSTIQLRYVEGNWSGFLALDVFNPCTISDCSVICDICCMTTAEGIFDNNSQFQGILGLAYSSIANPNSSVRPFIDVFTYHRNVNDIFALHLCGPFFSSQWPVTQCGKLHVGYYSEKYLIGSIMYTPIVREWFYEVTVTDVKVNNISVPLACSELNKNISIIDSGTTELKLPKTAYYWVLSKIKNHVKDFYAKELWFFETTICVQNGTLNSSKFPIITLALYHSKTTSFLLNISPELYLLRDYNSTDICARLAISISNYGTVIGSTVLKGFYVIFDRDKKQVGFAKPIVPYKGTFISDISNHLTESIDFDECIRKDKIDKNNISVLIILGLCFLCIIAAILLYALIKWIWNFHLSSDAASDTSSLVDEE